MFSTHGVPEEVKSDNGPPFQSTNFKRLAEHSGFEHRKITHVHPGHIEFRRMRGKKHVMLKACMFIVVKALNKSMLQMTIMFCQQYI